MTEVVEEDANVVRADSAAVYMVGTGRSVLCESLD